MKTLYVVGIGPGNAGGMTIEAREAIATADIIVGYHAYLELVRPLFPDKPVFDTGMTREVERCKKALAFADRGKTVALVCSGDAGVYAMSGLVYELSKEAPEVEIKVIPGVTAALSGAAILGAPLTHDFAVISLSDLLTPWELIEKRLACAAMGDFCIVLYNPGSVKRADYLRKACDILLEYKFPDTVCGIARSVGRIGEDASIMTLSELREFSADMFTTVFIGNSETKVIGGKMVTPRGYRID